MPFELKSNEMGLELALSGRLSVQQATLLWTTVQPAIVAGAKIRLLAADLDEMDTSIVQILCRLGEQKPQRPALLEIAQVSDGFIRSLKRCGLEKFFVRASATPSRIATEPEVRAEAVPELASETAEAAGPDPMARVPPEFSPSKKRAGSKSHPGSRVNA